MDVARRISPARRLVPRGVAVLTVSTLIGTAVWGSQSLIHGYSSDVRIDRASVITDIVHRGTIVRSISASGTIAARRVAIVAAPDEGVVAAILVHPGSAVRAGTPIVRLTNPSIDADIADATAQLLAAQADLASVRQQTITAQLERKQTLRATQADRTLAADQALVQRALNAQGYIGDLAYRESIVKLAEVSDRETLQRAEMAATIADGRAKLAGATAHVVELEGLLARKRATADALLVRAATDGIVQSVAAQLGARVSPGSELARVADEHDLEAKLAVVESDARAVEPGQRVVIQTSAGTVVAHVSHIDPAASAGSVAVEATFDDRPRGIRTDENIQGQIELGRIADTLWIERPAGVNDDSSVQLFRLTGSDRAQRVTVLVGRGSADKIAIRSGLRAGDSVIVSDMSAAGDHATVVLQ